MISVSLHSIIWVPMQDNSDIDDIVNQDEQPSKTKRKLEMHALQAVGTQLADLDIKRLHELNLPEQLMAAILEAKKIYTHGARRRQFQYIGKIMRHIDMRPIQEKLEAWRTIPLERAAWFHQLEHWRERLLNEEQALTEFAQQFPQADLQQIRLLIRNARKEKLANKPPKSFRLLFQVLREITSVESTK